MRRSNGDFHVIAHLSLGGSEVGPKGRAVGGQVGLGIAGYDVGNVVAQPRWEGPSHGPPGCRCVRCLLWILNSRVIALRETPLSWPAAHSLTESSASGGYFVLLLLGLAGPQVPVHVASLQYREKLAKPPPAGGPLPAGDGSVGVARDGFRYGAVSSESRPLSVLDLGCIRVIPTPKKPIGNP